MNLPRTRRGLATLAAALLGSALLAAPVAAQDGPLAEPREATARTVAITSITPQVLTPDETLVVVARVHNAGEEEIADPVARLHVNRFRVVDRAGVDAWADLGPGEPPGSVVATERLEDPLPPGATRAVRFEIAGRELGFLDLPDTWGPRGLAVSLADGAATVDVDRSFILWLSTDQVPQTRVSILAPLTGNPVDVPAWTVSTASNGASPDPEPDGEQPAGEPDDGDVLGAEAIGPLVSAQGRLAAVLGATAAHKHVAYAVDPAVVAASLASSDSAASAWTAQLLETLDGRDVFALAWADPDVAALARGEGDALLDGALRLSAERSEELLRRSVRTELVWPAGGLADATTLEFAARAGAKTVVAAPGVLAPALDPSPVSPTGRTTVATEAGDVVVLVPDAGLVADLVSPVGSTPATIAQRLLAETAVIAREPSTELRHLVIALPRDWHPDPTIVQAQLEALSAAPWVDPTALSSLLGTPDPRVERKPLPRQADDREMLDTDTVADLSQRLAFATDFAPVLTAPDRFLARQTAQLLAPTAVAWRADPAGRADLAARVIEEAEARTVGLEVVTGSDVSLIAAEGEVPVTVRNGLVEDANVVVELRPSSGVLVAGDPVTVLVAAGEQATVRVPVRSVANGDVTIEVALLSPEGRPVAPSSSFGVRVRAEWENVGTGVVAALLGVGLVAGIVRTVRRGRAGTRLDAADVPELAREAGQ